MEEAEFNKLCRLCRLYPGEEEKKNLSKSIEEILAYIKQLDEVETEGIEPCFTVHETIRSVMRDDVPTEPLSRDLFLKNAPSSISGMVKVPPVFKP
jgi:aspartyl-tRNA(Asn)/glutamyl-tRNA(Gln) amidotransferase subunit C